MLQPMLSAEAWFTVTGCPADSAPGGLRGNSPRLKVEAPPAPIGRTLASPQRSPFEFWMAVKFGLLLAVVIVLARALKEWAGDAGVFLVAGASGFVDLDAATLSLARMAPDQIPIVAGVGAVLLVSVTNTIFKAAIAVFNSKAALLAPIVNGVGAQLAAIAVGAVVLSGTITGSG